MKKLLLLCGVVTTCIIASFTVQISHSQEPSNKPAITVQELQKTRIIGYLGLPLGTVTTVKAKWVESDTKESPTLLEIKEAAGKALPTSTRLHFSIWSWGNLHGKEVPIEKEVELRVYEDGGMEGVPYQAMKETVYVQTVDYQFRTRIVVLYEIK